MEVNIPTLYKKYNVDKDYTSIGLFRALKERFTIKKVFYPGCYAHITPSLVFSDVTYADSFRNTYKFFDNPNTLEYIKSKKEYAEEPIIQFYQQDYNKEFTRLTREFDVIISQYAGFVGQATKSYLKKGGILVCNDSHGDASLAALDSDYLFIGVYSRNADDDFTISNNNLHEYFHTKNGIKPTKEKVLQFMKGIAYTKKPSGYIFQLKK